MVRIISRGSLPPDDPIFSAVTVVFCGWLLVFALTEVIWAFTRVTT